MLSEDVVSYLARLESRFHNAELFLGEELLAYFLHPR